MRQYCERPGFNAEYIANALGIPEQKELIALVVRKSGDFLDDEIFKNLGTHINLYKADENANFSVELICGVVCGIRMGLSIANDREISPLPNFNLMKLQKEN